MSDETPTAASSKSRKADAETPVVDDASAETAGTPVDGTAAEPVETPAAETSAAEPVVVGPAAATGEVQAAGGASAAEPAPAAEPSEPVETPQPAPVAGQVVYVTAPVPPKPRGNRVIGSLLAVLGAVIFAGVYGIVAALIIDLQSGDLFGPSFGSFLGSAFFWVPGVVFLVGLVLLTLILNRAGWWAHVLGSLVLAIAVYFGMIGVLLLIGNVFHGSPEPIAFAQLAVNPWVIAAAIVAREVSIWIGLAIAARGRRVKARNVESRAAFDREQEEKKAEYERGTAAA